MEAEHAGASAGARAPGPRIVVVGPCAAGKSTLVGNLRPRGYAIRTCAQEHSHVQQLWLKYCRADVLIYLDAGLETIARRQGRADWTQARLDEQHRRLADARRHCDFYLYTDGLSREEVADQVERFLNKAGLPGEITRRESAAGGQAMDDLIAVILTYNEEKQIGACIDSVDWCDRVIVWDSFSTDRTCEIARERGAEVHQHPFKGYGSQRQAAMDALEARWVLFVDADERVTPELAVEVRAAIVEQPEVVGWWIPRHNYIFGRLTLHTGWYPDYQLRLLRMDCSRWDPEREVHELAILDGPDGHLENVLIHYNYDSLRLFIAKQNRYVEIDAGILDRAGERVKPWSPFWMPFRHFKWRFIDLEGYRDGLHGLWLCVLMSYYEGKKYARLARLRRQGK